MSQFINPEDYDASIHREILDALIREDESLLEVCEDQAIAEMRGYLSSRFDCDKIFAATGSERHPLVLMYAKDITLYHVSAEDFQNTDRPLRAKPGMAERRVKI